MQYRGVVKRIVLGNACTLVKVVKVLTSHSHSQVYMPLMLVMLGWRGGVR